jgi:hypothetical protein
MKAIKNANRSALAAKDTEEAQKPKKRGRKRKVTDDAMMRKTIMGLAKRGTTLDDIADIVGVSRAWLTREYGNEIKNGRQIANALVVENLYQQAMKDTPSSINAGIYLTRSQMGWKDKHDQTDMGRPQVVFDFGQLSYEERAYLIDKVRDKIGGPKIIEGEVFDEITSE